LKKPSYFISSRSASADRLASELILALHDQYPKVECSGILGEWGSRTRCTKLAGLETFTDLQDRPLAASTLAMLDGLKKEINDSNPQVAIFVGYSYLHHELAGFCKSQGIPVLLYEITPVHASMGIDPLEIKDRVQFALAIHSQGSNLIRSAQLPYLYIGTPHKDKVDRIVVEAQSFKLSRDKPIVTLFPGNRPESFAAIFAVIQDLSKALLAETDWQLVLSLAENLAPIESIQKAIDDFASSLPKGNEGRFLLLQGMHLELLSLSKLAISGVGAITIECGLSQVPCLPIYVPNPEQGAPYSLLNQSLGKEVLREFSSTTPVSQLLKAAKDWVNPGAERDEIMTMLAEVKNSFAGYAADNAADYIGREVGKWKQYRRKGTKTA
jgi:lipid A disaccharide synthetase